MSFIKDTFFGGAERDAAREQARASDAAIAESRSARDQARSDLQPFAEAGGGILNTLLEFTKTGPETDLERTEGFTEIQNSAAAGGKLQSGGMLKGLAKFNSLLNFRNRAQRFNELFNLATLGSNAASGQATSTLSTGRDIADTTVGKGDALAAGRVGAANNTRNTLFSLLQLGLS